MTSYITINHGMQSAFVERRNFEISYFYLPHGEMSITLDNVSCLLHLLIRGILLDHNKINRVNVLDMMVTYLGLEQKDALKEIEDTRGCHVRFGFLEIRMHTI